MCPVHGERIRRRENCWGCQLAREYRGTGDYRRRIAERQGREREAERSARREREGRERESAASMADVLIAAGLDPGEVAEMTPSARLRKLSEVRRGA